ncbi:MAG: excisionase family DNA-binding protein [Planctomycetaceae bacterium]
MSANRRLLTIREAAGLLCCSEANVYALKEAGELPFVCVGVQGYRIDSSMWKLSLIAKWPRSRAC